VTTAVITVCRSWFLCKSCFLICEHKILKTLVLYDIVTVRRLTLHAVACVSKQ